MVHRQPGVDGLSHAHRVVLFVRLGHQSLARRRLGPGDLLLLLVVPALWALVVWTMWFGRVGPLLMLRGPVRQQPES
jgi:hypothetical protein